MGHPGKPTSRPYDIAPVLLGEGIAFSPGSGRVDLELIDSTRSGGLTSLRYRVRRSRAR